MLTQNNQMAARLGLGVLDGETAGEITERQFSPRSGPEVKLGILRTKHFAFRRSDPRRLLLDQWKFSLLCLPSGGFVTGSKGQHFEAGDSRYRTRAASVSPTGETKRTGNWHLTTGFLLSCLWDLLEPGKPLSVREAKDQWSVASSRLKSASGNAYVPQSHCFRSYRTGAVVPTVLPEDQRIPSNMTTNR